MVRFGPFQIDERTWTLTREANIVDLSPRLVEILAHLAARPGEIVTKEQLLQRFWPDTFVTENTLTRAVADIRKAIDDRAERPAYIQTLARRGYRFVGTLAIAPPAAAADATDPLRSWVDGRLALESLDESRLTAATDAFARTAAAMPDYAPAHAGLANAYLVRFETTRLGNTPDRARLAESIAAARQTCALDPQMGEGWAVLAHALTLAGQAEDARAAARRAVSLENGNWRHQFRLALASWGEERLRATDRTLALMPGCAAAHLLSAMVFVARGALDPAARAAVAGATLQADQTETATLPAAGLHWMSGLVACAAGDHRAAAHAFEREIADASTGRVYGREFVLNAWTALGFLWHHTRDDRAAHAFGHALTLQPGHARAVLGLVVSGGPPENLDGAIGELEAGGKTFEATMIRAASLGARGEQAAAIDVLNQGIAAASPGPAGWALRADPMFLALRTAEGFAHVLATVAARAA